MPISHKHKIIFVHIPKCGGVSVSHALGVHENRERGVASTDLLYGFHKGKHLQHLTLREIKEIVPAEIFNTYTKISFVRNPYDRLVSEYVWRKNLGESLNIPLKDLAKKYVKSFKSRLNEFRTLSPLDIVRKNIFLLNERNKKVNNLSMKEFLSNVVIPEKNTSPDSHFRDQYEFLIDDNGEIGVDFVGRFENLTNDFNEFFNNRGHDIQLPHKNKTKRTSYKDYFDEELIRLGFEIYKKDLQYFNYSF